ncbi:MAG TPA: sigma-70 family RNA polymerase sigma factor [Polyangiaceae bacterium]|nr:sigma-70 family RNA polymerase sigma factor [Polyangiaceae bacterium]
MPNASRWDYATGWDVAHPVARAFGVGTGMTSGRLAGKVVFVAQGDPPEVLERFDGNLDLVEIIARQVGRTLGRSIELDDLISYGREGLLEAARRFDADRGVPFRAYANFRVRGAVIDGVRALSHLPRRVHERLTAYQAATRFSEGAAEDAFAQKQRAETREEAARQLGEHLGGMATAMAVGLVARTAWGEDGEQVGVARDDNPEDAVGRAQLLQVVRDAIVDLPEQEAELVRRHYLEGERFDHVAEELGLSKSWASRLHTRAMARLAKRLRGMAG